MNNFVALASIRPLPTALPSIPTLRALIPVGETNLSGEKQQRVHEYHGGPQRNYRAERSGPYNNDSNDSLTIRKDKATLSALIPERDTNYHGQKKQIINCCYGRPQFNYRAQTIRSFSGRLQSGSDSFPKFPRGGHKDHKFEGYKELDKGVHYKEIQHGTGEQPKDGDEVLVSYTVHNQNNTEETDPIETEISVGRNNELGPGFDKAIRVMKTGGKAWFIIYQDLWPQPWKSLFDSDRYTLPKDIFRKRPFHFDHYKFCSVTLCSVTLRGKSEK